MEPIGRLQGAVAPDVASGRIAKRRRQSARWCIAGTLACAAATAGAAPVVGRGTWESSLSARDLTGDGVADAFYDSTLDVTWLADWNSVAVDSWAQARDWAAGLRLGGSSGWRLPSIVDTGTPGCNWSLGGTDCGYNPQIFNPVTGAPVNELAHMWFVTLGNLAPYYPGTGTGQPGWGLVNTGPFLNLLDSEQRLYWQREPVAVPFGAPTMAWSFDVHNGYQTVWNMNAGLLVVAVHDGDLIAAVPEPSAMSLGVAGLLALAIANFLAKAKARTSDNPRPTMNP